MEKYLTTREAAAMIGCSVTHARSLSGKPDDTIILRNGVVRNLYLEHRIITIAADYRNHVIIKKKNFGKRSCRSCKQKYAPSHLLTGKCHKCHAEQWMWNFLCHGDCFLNEPDCEMIVILEESIIFIKEKLEKRKSCNTLTKKEKL